MVDRLFWRAGFGPSAADRATWTGQAGHRGRRLAARHARRGRWSARSRRVSGQPLDPFGDEGGDTDLVLHWVDRMVRTPAPFVERLTFFWHRLWANSRLEVSPPQLLVQQNDLFRDYADLGHPNTADRDFGDHGARGRRSTRRCCATSTASRTSAAARTRTTPASSWSSSASASSTPAGKPNYTEDDVKNLAKALSGYRLDETDPNNVSASFDSSRWFQGFKILSWGARQHEHGRRREQRARPPGARELHREPAVVRVHRRPARRARRSPT